MTKEDCNRAAAHINVVRIKNGLKPLDRQIIERVFQSIEGILGAPIVVSNVVPMNLNARGNQGLKDET